MQDPIGDWWNEHKEAFWELMRMERVVKYLVTNHAKRTAALQEIAALIEALA